MAETDTEMFCLVLAALYKANPGLTINYKVMAELSGGKRTHVAYEHKVRPLRKRAQDILAAADAGGDGAVAAPPTPRKRGKNKKDQAEEAADGEEMETKPAKPPRKPRAKKAKTEANTDATNHVAPSAPGEMSFEFEDGKGNVIKAEDDNDDDLYV